MDRWGYKDKQGAVADFTVTVLESPCLSQGNTRWSHMTTLSLSWRLLVSLEVGFVHLIRLGVLISEVIVLSVMMFNGDCECNGYLQWC